MYNSCLCSLQLYIFIHPVMFLTGALSALPLVKLYRTVAYQHTANGTSFGVGVWVCEHLYTVCVRTRSQYERINTSPEYISRHGEEIIHQLLSLHPKGTTLHSFITSWR